MDWTLILQIDKQTDEQGNSNITPKLPMQGVHKSSTHKMLMSKYKSFWLNHKQRYIPYLFPDNLRKNVYKYNNFDIRISFQNNNS